ncbi:hypothetical protein EYV94_02115 [Puteibacter caeruleilacunae]|nr:hypothetical protein EYV94_02115 [Puteibacter caeruleilacunae]
MKNIDLKSFLIGVLATACVVLMISSTNSVPRGPRYQLENDPISGYAYVLDTYTGSVTYVKMNKALRAKGECVSARRIQEVMNTID